MRAGRARKGVVGETMTAAPGKSRAMVLDYRCRGRVRLSVTGEGETAAIGAPAANP